MKGLRAMGIVLRFCVGFPFPNNYVEYRSLVGDVSRGAVRARMVLPFWVWG